MANMERPSKRRRLYGPLDAQVSQSFDSGHEFYNAPDEVHEEESESAYGPDQELEQKRARLDLKLKSTFESIFEKYGKDFEGVGDEIDLYTGEILVDNGHLLQMRNERDAGDPSRAQRFPRALVADSELVSGSMEDDYLDEEEDEDEDEDEEGDDEEDYDNDGALSDEEMIEDDLILRGFAQARQFMQRWPSEQQKTFNGVLAGHRKEQRQNTVLNSAMMRSMLPSRSDILSQFGPQLGPEIVKYVSQQAVLDDDNVEPMWRAPPILTTTVATYPKTKSAALQPESQRPKSPDNSPSIWAPQRSRFRAEEDELLQDFVANARKVGLDLSNNKSWKRLEDIHPRHDWKSWKTRYEKKFSYLCPGHVDDSEISTSEVSADTPWMANQRDRDRLANSRLDIASSTRQPPPPTTNSRPIRARKPARRDSTILSWTDAVATIESVDPDLHAGLLKDVKAIKSDASFGFQRFNPSSKIPERHIIQDPTAFNKQTGSNQEPNGSAKHAIHSDNTIADSEDELSLQSPEFHRGSQKVPCPHADCRASQSTLYRLNCYDDEELSPLCLHLLHIHHNTPFPCVEFNCERKGERGYFMQEDLVRHVKEVHPYATALSRLRGRVDAELLDGEPKSTRSQLLTTIRPRTPVSQRRESGFMSPRGGGGPAQPSIQMLSLSSANDLTFNTRPVHYDQAGSASALSLRVNPASSVAKAMQLTEGSAEKLYDSDVQILESNPFLTECHSLSKPTQLPCPLRDSSGCDEMFASSKLAVSHSLIHNGNLKKASCTHLGCEKIISTHPSTMITHLKTHEKDHSNISASSTRQAITSEQQPSQHTSMPMASSSSLRTTSKPTSTVTKKNTRGTTRKRVSDPLPQNKVDPSYQFSDEEVDLRLLQNEALQVTKAEPAQPRPARMSMPSAKAHAKTIFTSALKKPHVTPLFKPTPRKSAVKGTVAAEEFDELSLPCDGDLMFISSRSRSGDLPSIGSRMRVKQEDADIPSGSIASSRKRNMGMLDWSDEIDELGSDNIPNITSARGIQNLPAHCDVKMEEEAIPTSRLEVKGQAATSRARKQKAPYQSDSQPTVTPTRSHKPSSGTNTPLMDLVGDDDQEVDLGIILPTSAMDSSPTARKTRNRIGREVAGSGSGARFGLRPVPRAMVKEEEGAVWTPGGTLRRCGQEGFACGRPFCFSCPQQA